MQPVVDLPFLRVRGTDIVDDRDQTTLLRGYNVGGALNMENFLTGYPGTESQQRRALFKALGQSRYDLFFSRFLAGFFADADAAYLASLGMNSIRLPFNYRHFEDDLQPFVLKEDGFALLDDVVASCRRHGLYVILDFHALPGAQNRHWHSDNPTHHPMFWDHVHFQDRAVHLWEAIATRYRDEPAIAGYNVMNEPGDIDGVRIRPFYDRAVTAIRAIDEKHIIFLDGNCYATDFSTFAEAPIHSNTVYALHDYHLPGFSYGGPYPGTTHGTFVDRGQVERTFLARAEFMRATGTPIYVGEFGPVFTGNPEQDTQRLALLKDQLDIYREHSASWSLWGYKDIGGQGVVYARPDSPWRRRIRPVTEKKARLGVDGWGSDDNAVRHIMDPIERTFAEEYPDFDPFPFGLRDWLTLLVRSIVLAEPMLADFELCFTDITDDDEVRELADSFRFERCAIREPLADLLAHSLQPEISEPTIATG